MASRVVMPKLSDTMEEGVLLAWKKHEGDQVQAGEVLAEIETDKAVMDLEAFASGVHADPCRARSSHCLASREGACRRTGDRSLHHHGHWPGRADRRRRCLE